MAQRYRVISSAHRKLTGLAVALMSGLAIAQAPADGTIPAEVAALAATFNDDPIPFNEQLVVLGKADAPVTAILIYGLSADTGFFMDRLFSRIKSRYVDTGKIRLIVYDFPLTWHDMQALAGFRCLPADKHLAVMEQAVRYNVFAHELKAAPYLSAPEHVWRLLKDYDIPREKAEKCMRNAAIIGYVEGLRRNATATWQVTVAPTFIVGDTIVANPSSIGPLEDALKAALKQ